MIFKSIDTINLDFSDYEEGALSNNTLIGSKTLQDLISLISKSNKSETFNIDNNLSSDSNSSYSNKSETIEASFNDFYTNFINVIMPISKHDNYESGVISNTSLEILNFFNIDPTFTKKCVQKLFWEMFDNSQLIIGILDGIASIEYNLAKDEFPIAAVAAFAHENDEVVEYGIRCFESWRNIDSLRTLRKLKCREEWMNIYVKKIILEIEKELS